MSSEMYLILALLSADKEMFHCNEMFINKCSCLEKVQFSLTQPSQSGSLSLLVKPL